MESYVCKNYSETKMLIENEEVESWSIDDVISMHCDLSFPDRGGLAESKSILSERNRRKKQNDRLNALRAVVPNITKLDKASIIKDAIGYIQELHEQEKRFKAEIVKLQSGKLKKNPSGFARDQQELPVLLKPGRKNNLEQQFYVSGRTTTSPVEVLGCRVVYMGEKTLLVSLTCTERADTMFKLCQVFESLKLKIITANITTNSGRLLKTAFIEAEGEDRDVLKTKIETAIAALSDPDSPMSSSM